jgi:hypothetical protein
MPTFTAIKTLLYQNKRTSFSNHASALYYILTLVTSQRRAQLASVCSWARAILPKVITSSAHNQGRKSSPQAGTLFLNISELFVRQKSLSVAAKVIVSVAAKFAIDH